jgi:hypothetical protein
MFFGGSSGGGLVQGMTGAGNSMFGTDVQAHNLPFIGNMFPNPNEAAMQQRYAEAMAALSQYRPVQQRAAMNALRNQSTMLQPMNNAMGEMYGPGAQASMAGIKNPFSAGGGGRPPPPGQGRGYNGTPAGKPDDSLGSAGGRIAPDILRGGLGVATLGLSELF